MRRLYRRLAVLACCLVAANSFAETRALILVSNYESAANPGFRLLNPVADGKAIDRTLRRAGIDDIVFVEEPVYEDWSESIDRFVARLGQDDIAFVYYAGHGFQMNGANYFLTSDGTTLVGMDSLLSRVAGKARGLIVVVDACRNNPLNPGGVQDELRVRGLEVREKEPDHVSLDELLETGEGLAQVSNLTGLSTVVFFSTEPGNVAEDGKKPGKGSPFAQAFAKELWRRQSLDDVFRYTAIRVNKETDGRQSPWRQGDLPFDVYLAGMKGLPTP
jgi:uncharacterized caspase-like protein